MHESQLISNDEGQRVYHYNELPDKAKEKARNHYIENWVHDDWYDYIYEDAKEAGAMRGFEIDKMLFSGFWSQGDGASWTGYVYLPTFINFYLPELTNKSIGRDAWLWLMLDGWVHDRVSIYQNNTYYCHENTMSVGNIEVYEHDDMVLAVECILQGAPIATIWNLITTDTECPIKSADDLEEFVLEKARRFAQYLYKRLEEGYERECSDEQIGDTYDANNVLFNEEGVEI
jgi:hypothetical protein